MKAIIDRGGLLSLERVGKALKPQRCMHRAVRCGDWCPLFEEPSLITVTGGDTWGINICNNRTLTITELIDEREG